MRAPIRAETSDYVKLWVFYQPWTLKPITNINIYLQLLIKGQFLSQRIFMALFIEFFVAKFLLKFFCLF